MVGSYWSTNTWRESSTARNGRYPPPATPPHTNILHLFSMLRYVVHCVVDDVLVRHTLLIGAFVNGVEPSVQACLELQLQSLCLHTRYGLIDIWSCFTLAYYGGTTKVSILLLCVFSLHAPLPEKVENPELSNTSLLRSLTKVSVAGRSGDKAGCKWGREPLSAGMLTEGNSRRREGQCAEWHSLA